jgi:hypothetical protein
MKEKKIIQISLKLRPSTAERLHRAAQRNDRSVNYIVETILRKYFNLKQ